MTLKLKPVLVKAFTLVQSRASTLKHGALAAIAATAISLTPTAAKAQLPLVTEIFPFLSGIELTSQQKIQLADLGSQALSQFEQIVTADQRTQFRTALGQGKSLAEALTVMNITPQQQTQLQGAFRTATQQLISTLTPAQRQKILQNMQTLLQVSPGQ